MESLRQLKQDEVINNLNVLCIFQKRTKSSYFVYVTYYNDMSVNKRGIVLSGCN